MKNTVQQLADLVQGSVEGDCALVVHSARTLNEAKSGDITFVENLKYALQLQRSDAVAAIVPRSYPANGKILIRVADPLMAFVTVFQHFNSRPIPQPMGIDPRAAVHPGARIGADASIDAMATVAAGAIVGKRCRLGAGVVIGANCRIGDDVVLHPNVVLYHDVVIGDRVIIHANSVIGADGYGYRFQQGRHIKVPQLGSVEIGCDVEIGACTTIDRGTFEATRIGDGTKIDNLVQVAHNCKIGKHNLMAAQVGFAGSCTTGNYVIIGGQAGLADHVDVCEGAVIGAKSGISKTIQPGAQVMGFPARPVREARRIFACLDSLPELRRDVARLKKLLGLADASIENPAESEQKVA